MKPVQDSEAESPQIIAYYTPYFYASISGGILTAGLCISKINSSFTPLSVIVLICMAATGIFFSATQVFIRKTRSHSKKAVLIKKISTLSICAFLFFSAMLIYVVRYRPAIDKFIGVRFDPGTRAEYFTGEGIPVLVSHVKGFDRLFYKIEGYIAEPHRLIRIQKRDGLEISVPLSKKSGLLLPVYKVLIESRWERTDITPRQHH